MNETSKAFRRRWKEDMGDVLPFKWHDLLTGQGIDLGAGPDPVPLPNFRAFDQKDGDANHLTRYFKPDTFDVIHGSQVLEHMRDPAAALRDWLVCLKPGGYIIQTVPSWELYETLVWPSRFNGDHKSTWSLWLPNSPAPIHCKLPEWLDQFGCEVMLCRLVDANYDYRIMQKFDQTWEEARGTECWLEFVLKKP